jgi:predicted TIM-barrel fold metal-dependent hydrolase
MYGGGGAYGDNYSYEIDNKLQELDDFNIDYSVLNSTRNLNISSVNNDQLAMALADAYNSYILDFFGEDEKFKANILTAPKNPHHAAEQIDENASEDSFVGVAMYLGGLTPPAGDKIYQPLIEAAAKHDLPLVFHSAGAGLCSAFPSAYNGAQTYIEEHAISHPFQHISSLTSLLFNGIPERYPSLDFVFVESGIGYVPYMKWRLDDHYLEAPDQIPGLNRLPSSYIDDQFYFTTQPLGHTGNNPSHIAKAIEMAGPGSIMYSADLPHADFDPPSELFNRINGHFDPKIVRGIMGETAADLFNLG